VKQTKALIKAIKSASTAYTLWLDAELGPGDADEELKAYRAAVNVYAEAYQAHRRETNKGLRSKKSS